MPKLLLLLTTMLSLNIMAYEPSLVPLKKESCQSTFDVYDSQRKNFYTLTDPSVENKKDHVVIKMKITFLKCTYEAGEFLMIPKDEHIRTHYHSLINSEGEVMEVLKLDLEKEVLAINKEAKIVSQYNVFDHEAELEIKLILLKSDLDTNKFPRAYSRGQYYTTLSLRSKTKFISPLISTESTYLFGREIRIFFNL